MEPSSPTEPTEPTESSESSESSSLLPTTTTTTTEATIHPAIAWLHPNNALAIGFSILLVIGTFVWIWFYCKRKHIKETSKPSRPKSKDRSQSRSPSPRTSERKDEALPGSAKTPSLVSIQSTGSNYYDQLMGSGNIPKVKSISQYGALLAQQEPPPP